MLFFEPGVSDVLACRRRLACYTFTREYFLCPAIGTYCSLMFIGMTAVMSRRLCNDTHIGILILLLFDDINCYVSNA